MKLFIDDEEIIEMKIEDSLKSEDKGIIIGNNRGRPEGKTNSELQKEFAAIDSLDLGIVKSGEINDVCFKSAALYRDGENVNPETKTAILNYKYQIEDKATTKLMQTLDLFDPTDIEKQTDLIAAADKLSNIVERISGKDNKSGQSVHLHLYNPTQKKISSYDVIDV